jgi:DNA adenine methylase
MSEKEKYCRPGAVVPAPFLKWAGGKARLVAQYAPFFPREFRRYFEPFLGGGAVFFHLGPKESFLYDINEELVNCYLQVRDNPAGLMEMLEFHKKEHYRDGPAHYYGVRGADPAGMNPLERAARMIYLNKTCYNGLYRVNSSGQFNVPFGRYKNPRIFDRDALAAASRALQGAIIKAGDFLEIEEEAGPGDLVYFDPPYLPLSSTSNFTDYIKNADYFGEDAQAELAGLFGRLARKGCLVMLSNSDTPLINELYEGFHVHTIMAPRFINSKGDGRSAISELLITSFPPGNPRAGQKKAGVRAGKSSKYWKPWEKIIEKKLDPSLPVTLVSADEIKEITGMEPRLLTKFDTRRDLPPALKDRGLFILPISNGSYGLVQGDGYHDLEPIPGRPERHQCRLPFPLQSSDYGTSEMSHIDYAYNTGLISLFTGNRRLFPTIRGRKYSPEFSFTVGGAAFPPVASVQVEVDGGYEGEKEIILIEAKVGTPSSFHVRQLYYPFRFWKEAVPRKNVRPVFFVFDPRDETYRLYEYRFADPLEMESIILVKAGKYQIQRGDEEGVLMGEFLEELPGERAAGEDFSIPQADDLKKIVAIPFLVALGNDTAAKMAEVLRFTQRQSSYYRKAVEDLGLLARGKGKYVLTEAGEAYVRLPVEKRNGFLARRIMEIPIMKEVVKELYAKKSLSIHDLALIVERCSHLSGATTMRRARTIRAWFWWLYSAVGIVKVGSDGIFI